MKFSLDGQCLPLIRAALGWASVAFTSTSKQSENSCRFLLRKPALPQWRDGRNGDRQGCPTQSYAIGMSRWTHRKHNNADRLIPIGISDWLCATPRLSPKDRHDNLQNVTRHLALSQPEASPASKPRKQISATTSKAVRGNNTSTSGFQAQILKSARAAGNRVQRQAHNNKVSD